MHEAADAACVTDFVQLVLQVASDEQIAGEKRLDDANNTAAGGPFEAESRVKNLQPEMPVEIGGRNVLVLRLRAHAIPS